MYSLRFLTIIYYLLRPLQQLESDFGLECIFQIINNMTERLGSDHIHEKLHWRIEEKGAVDRLQNLQWRDY